MPEVKPVNVTCSATFVVDLRKLQSPEDIKKDEFRIWNYSAFRVTEEEGGSLWIERCASGATGTMWSTSGIFAVLIHLIQTSNG